MLEMQKECKSYLNTALKTWFEQGVDTSYIEALDFDANPLPNLPRRGRVQARQLLVFAMAHSIGFDTKENQYLKQAEHLYQNIIDDYTINGILIFLHGEKIKDTHHFAYEQAFKLMALSWLYKTTNKEVYKDHAAILWVWLNDNLLNKKYDGFDIGLPNDQNNPRQQNPHMHLFEACIICYRNFNDNVWKERADWLFHLFKTYFWQEKHNSLIEFFTEDWQLHPEKGNHVDPGHHFEWCWLLGEYQKLTEEDISKWQQKLFKRGIAIGLNENSLGKDEVYLDGSEYRSTSRLWVQCELLKAYVAMYRLTTEDSYKSKATQLIEKIFTHYLKPSKGIWFDQLSKEGKNISQNSPASTFYHLFIAFNEYIYLSSSSAVFYRS